MGQHDPFQTWGEDLWAKLDDMDNSDWWQDSPEEQQEFENRVRDSMRAPPAEPQSANALNVSMQLSNVLFPDTTPRHVSGGASRSSPAPATQQLAAETPGGQPNKGRSFGTPLVDTPPAPKSLPRPRTLLATSTSTPTVSTRPPSALDTPDNVPTPTQTQADVSVGKGKRDDPATPVPLGDDSPLKKGPYTKITNQFNAFNLKILAAANRVGQESTRGSGKTRGRGRAIGLRTTRSTLRPEVLKGMRFCMPPEGPQCGAKHESRWSKVGGQGNVNDTDTQIIEYGGSVVIQPDTAVTHVIWDQGCSASSLAKKLGLQTLSELPEGTVCVKWNWVVQCQLTVSNSVNDC